nr:MAG TPA_asm: hypothetical protein [Caudoviricetes sp.]
MCCNNALIINSKICFKFCIRRIFKINNLIT